MSDVILTGYKAVFSKQNWLSRDIVPLKSYQGSQNSREVAMPLKYIAKEMVPKLYFSRNKLEPFDC